MTKLVYKRVTPVESIKPKESALDFSKFYEQTNPEFVLMFGDVIDYYCNETDSFHISEVNSEYQYFKINNPLAGGLIDNRMK